MRRDPRTLISLWQHGWKDGYHHQARSLGGEADGCRHYLQSAEFTILVGQLNVHVIKKQHLLFSPCLCWKCVGVCLFVCVMCKCLCVHVFVYDCVFVFVYVLVWLCVSWFFFCILNVHSWGNIYYLIET